jgi:death-on-curing protein
MSEPKWVSMKDIVAIHGEQLAIFGGAPGIRDEGLLDSAMSRPLNRWHYGETDPIVLGDAYAFGIARNHPFIDGDKRSAFAAMAVFLRMNGVTFKPTPADATVAMVALAAGEVDEKAFARWIRDNSA